MISKRLVVISLTLSGFFVFVAAVIETLADLDLGYPEVGENKLKELQARWFWD
jgi:hypothetical protein